MPGVPRSDGKPFCLVFTNIWLAKISKLPKALHNVNSARAITGFASVIIILLHHFSIAIHLHLACFYVPKLARKSKIIEYESKGPGPSGRTCTSTTGYFYDKTKISSFSSGSLFIAKILQEAMYFTFLYLGQSTKFNPKMQDFKLTFKQKIKLLLKPLSSKLPTPSSADEKNSLMTFSY